MLASKSPPSSTASPPTKKRAPRLPARSEKAAVIISWCSTSQKRRPSCDYIRNGGDKEAFLKRFDGAYSPGFDPDEHLRKVGVANQTTMLRSETEEVQRRVRAAIADRDHGNDGTNTGNFRFFDTICGATQERQDALFELLRSPLDMLLVVGGYNSSNTTHLAEIGEREKVPTFFVRNAECLHSADEIAHYDLHFRTEILGQNWLPSGPLYIGITAGASCPNNLIEDVIRRLLELRGANLASGGQSPT